MFPIPIIYFGMGTLFKKNEMKQLCFLSSLLLVSEVTFAHDKPNIIVFLVDDMGVMDTSVPFLTESDGTPCTYPLNEWYRTPNMERMANQGIRFSTFYAQSVSSPSRASLMTGQNSARHGVTTWINVHKNNKGKFGPTSWNWDGVELNSSLLPKMLSKNGYKTIHVGKSHFGRIGSPDDDPKNLGFEVATAHVVVGPRSYLGEENFGYTGIDDPYFPKGLEEYAGKDIFLTEAVTQKALKEMDVSLEEKRPFFLYMSHYAVHAPFFADKRFMDNYQSQGMSEPAQRYASMIEGMDKSLGDILDYLNEKNIADNTLIFFIGDNGSDAPLGDEKGFTSSAPLRGKKGTEYEGGSRVPFIACWGKQDKKNKWQQKLPIPCNKIQQQMGTIMDVYPTILSLLDITKAKEYPIDGQDLSIQLKGNKNETRKEMMMIHFPHEHRGSYFTTYRKNDWKLIYYYNPKLPEYPQFELYNLKKDPFELHDYATTESQILVEMINEMKDELVREGAKCVVDQKGSSIYPFTKD